MVWYGICLKEIRFCAQDMIIVLGSIVNIVGERSLSTFNVHENLQFDNLSSENYEESVYNLELGLLTILYSIIPVFSNLGEVG